MPEQHPVTDLALVGAGSVATALSRNALARGLRTEHWVRDPAAAVPPGAGVRRLADVTPAVRTVVLAVPFGAVDEVVPTLPLLPGSVLVDATNPFGQPVPDGFASGADQVASLAPAGVQVVKAFNVLGAEHMAEPGLPDGHEPVLPVAGAAEPRAAVAALARRLGFDAVEVGGLEAAGVLEEVARFWGLLAFAGGRGRQVVLVAQERSRG